MDISKLTKDDQNKTFSTQQLCLGKGTLLQQCRKEKNDSTSERNISSPKWPAMKYKETRFTFCRWHCTRWVMVICVSFSFLSWVTTRVYPEVILTGLSSCLFPTSWVVICCCTQTLQASVSLLCDWSSHSQTRQDCLPGTLHLQARMVMMNICQ